MGPKTYIGAHGVAVTDIGPQGTVHVRSEQWTAEADEPILRGDKIVVIGVDGLRVKVKKV
jgi:membrane-bound serine protease (ClpP class)